MIQPLGGDTSWQQFLDKNGEGVQHVAFQVADLDTTIKGFVDSGMPVCIRAAMMTIRRVRLRGQRDALEDNARMAWLQCDQPWTLEAQLIASSTCR